MSDGVFRASDLRRVEDRTLVERIGGPHDGELRPLCENARVRGGLYAPMNADAGVVAMIYVPDEEWA